jgi:hypothetical protein
MQQRTLQRAYKQRALQLRHDMARDECQSAIPADHSFCSSL